MLQRTEHYAALGCLALHTMRHRLIQVLSDSRQFPTFCLAQVMIQGKLDLFCNVNNTGQMYFEEFLDKKTDMMTMHRTVATNLNGNLNVM
jgi:hypothetical protein